MLFNAITDTACANIVEWNHLDYHSKSRLAIVLDSASIGPMLFAVMDR